MFFQRYSIEIRVNLFKPDSLMIFSYTLSETFVLSQFLEPQRDANPSYRFY